jgi:hypothetical protein
VNRFKRTTAMLSLLAAGCAPSMRADERDKDTRLTINQPLLVRDTLLAPGQYVFKLIAPGVVSIRGADGTSGRIVLGWPAYRVDRGGKELFTVYEVQGNQPTMLKDWFYPGNNSGLEFSAGPLASGTGSVARSKKNGSATEAADGATSTP